MTSSPSFRELLTGSRYWELLQSTGFASLIVGKDADRLRPCVLYVGTVNRCNFDCAFCPVSKTTRPRNVMPMDMFERVVRQYEAMGGGVFSLTPFGEFLLDPLLPDRLSVLASRKGNLRPSLTTNLSLLGRWDDKVVEQLLFTMERLHISIYGTTEREFTEITRRPGHIHAEVKSQLTRLLSIRGRRQLPTTVLLNFRRTCEWNDAEMEGIVEEWCGEALPWSATLEYGNWGGDYLSGNLPGNARFRGLTKRNGPCVSILLYGIRVLSDGRVTTCMCVDIDGNAELRIGDVSQASLDDIYNSWANYTLWDKFLNGRYPRYCEQCSHYQPLDDRRMLEIAGQQDVMWTSGF